MAVKFTPIGWIKWLGLYVRQAKSVQLIGEEGEKVGAPAELIGASWTIEARRPGLVAATYPELLWRFTGPKRVSGCEVRDEGGEILWVDEFPFVEDRPPLVEIHAVVMQVEIVTDN